MNAIVWDDKYDAPGEDIMKRLVAELASFGVRCEVAASPEELKQRVTGGSERFDFVLTDWVDESVLRKGTERGKDIVVGIRAAGKKMPIFVLSSFADQVDRDLLRLAEPLLVKSKNEDVPFLALDIIAKLGDLGVRVDPTRVFIIYGHDRHAHGAQTKLVDFLKSLHLEPVLVEPWRSQHVLLPELQRQMNGCAAFIALCTPDDCVTEGLHQNKKWSQPRQNVLFELGMAMGLARGPERLTILQKSLDGDPDQFAKLPTDLDGFLTLRFEHEVSELFANLKRRLELLGLAIKPSTGSP